MVKFSEQDYFDSQLVVFGSSLDKLRSHIYTFYYADNFGSSPPIDIRLIKKQLLEIQDNLGPLQSQQQRQITSVSDIVMEVPNKKFVVSVLGDQQSGRTTLINQLYNIEQCLDETNDCDKDVMRIVQYGYTNIKIQNNEYIGKQAQFLESIYSGQDEMASQMRKCIQMIDMPTLDQINQPNQNSLKMLNQGIQEASDLKIIVLDSLDCDFRKSKIGQYIKKELSTQAQQPHQSLPQSKRAEELETTTKLWIILNKCDMLDTQDEINEQMQFIEKQVDELTGDTQAVNFVKIMIYSKNDKLLRYNLLYELKKAVKTKIQANSLQTQANCQKFITYIDETLKEEDNKKRQKYNDVQNDTFLKTFIWTLIGFFLYLIFREFTINSNDYFSHDQLHQFEHLIENTYNFLIANVGAQFVQLVLNNQKQMNAKLEYGLKTLEDTLGINNQIMILVMLIVIVIFYFTKKFASVKKIVMDSSLKERLMSYRFFLKRYNKLLDKKMRHALN